MKCSTTRLSSSNSKGTIARERRRPRSLSHPPFRQHAAIAALLREIGDRDVLGYLFCILWIQWILTASQRHREEILRSASS
ncbi:uncharacterized protein TRAVEDRAFT_31191 [Trametes versicolor FP-101664 SS1]|uniref:uncharacterized protein n=1 Tax=Trametes versicolor (strain FP-101664) TaxID=717944 RepID=UPI0004623DEC|nr:uncharacterized protein TRAVEDRAFT_31191 [Trametes versicolor FP-101664 SS1]EIW53986.1 hypothetical protein TRAVEDRAFT_31191 [Trametes versicolor FP-101664 SS1]